jgi:hypothetical protein
MNRKTPENRVFQGMGWMIGTVSTLFLISAGLELFVRQAFRQVSIATVLLALSLASWSYVLGLVGLIFLTVWWLVKLWHVRVKRVVMSRNSSAGSRSGHFEKPELRDSQYPQRGMAPTVPSRSSGESNDGNVTSSLTRVA